jgi:hypothetical protein
MNTPFEITKEEVLELAANKLVSEVDQDHALLELAEARICDQVDKIVAKGLKERVDAVLTSEMEALLSKEIVPVDIWGEKAGTPTTIRAPLHQRARDFWNVSVDREGRENTYDGTPRHKLLMENILKDEFEKSVKANADVIVAEFKKALLLSSTKMITDHINRLIR